jgi:hypothetical protein
MTQYNCLDYYCNEDDNDNEEWGGKAKEVAKPLANTEFNMPTQKGGRRRKKTLNEKNK